MSDFKTVFTVGHSNKSIDTFIGLLKEHDVQIIVDVRSHPFSKYSVQFDHDVVKGSLEKSGIRYLYLGKELGGMPKDDRLYDGDGNLIYAKVAQTPVFKEGINRLTNGARRFRIALMCGEENPSGCHRRHLIGPALLERGIEIKHIRADGTIQVEADFQLQESREPEVQQLRFF